MAGRAMKVAVLEGDFVALCNLGLPFSVSYQLQEKGLKLPDALLTVKSSTSGFSVSLFWPSSLCESLKKRCRKIPAQRMKNLRSLSLLMYALVSWMGHQACILQPPSGPQ